MISLYDEAVIKKFTKWLCAEDQKLTILGINETIELPKKDIVFVENTNCDWVIEKYLKYYTRWWKWVRMFL